MLECTVGEGEAVYFPAGWWHATLNLDESVFMSSFVNYRFDGTVGEDELWG
jgi:quercetin dioxygenase-like cupin family protein